MILTEEEYEALNLLINMEQLDLINDEENEFWNTIRRKLRSNSRIDLHCGSYKE
tara:strand:+ start:374 stop:535 length:162 start_codon:yes stop_codon:yes gene_type:complete